MAIRDEDAVEHTHEGRRPCHDQYDQGNGYSMTQCQGSQDTGQHEDGPDRRVNVPRDDDGCRARSQEKQDDSRVKDACQVARAHEAGVEETNHDQQEDDTHERDELTVTGDPGNHAALPSGSTPKQLSRTAERLMSPELSSRAVSYTHLRAHETDSY